MDNAERTRDSRLGREQQAAGGGENEECSAGRQIGWSGADSTLNNSRDSTNALGLFLLDTAEGPSHPHGLRARGPIRGGPKHAEARGPKGKNPISPVSVRISQSGSGSPAVAIDLGHAGGGGMLCHCRTALH